MKRGMILFSMVAMLAVSARCQTAMIALDDIPGTTLVCVTNYGPQVVSLTARVTGLEGSSNDWSKTVSNLAALSNNVSALSSRVTATNDLFSAWFSGLQSRTSYWDTAYSWGDWSVAVGANTAAIAVLQTNSVTRAGTNGFVTASITNGLASTSYVEAAVAAIPAADAFWPPNATASSWFTFTTNANEITITGYNIDGGTDVVIPDYINGWPVTEIGANAFEESGVTSIGGAGNVVTVGDYAFYYCTSLTSVSMPQAQTVGDSAFRGCGGLTSVLLPQAKTVGDYAFVNCTSLASFSLPLAQTVGDGAFYSCYSLASFSLPQAQTVGYSAFSGCPSLTSVPLPQVQTVEYFAFSDCPSLTSVSLPQAKTVGDSAFASCYSLTSVYFDNDAPTIGDQIFADINHNQVTIYVTNPQATGWGATLGGMPVVRLPMYADAIYQAGELVATTGYVAHASLADVDGYTTQMVMRVGSEIATNRWGPRLTLPDGIVTNGTDGPLALAGIGLTNGVIRASSGRLGRITIDDNGIHDVAWGTFLSTQSSLQMGLEGSAHIGGFYDYPNRFHGKENGTAKILELFDFKYGPRTAYFDHDGSLMSSGTVSAASAILRDSGQPVSWEFSASNGVFYASTNGVRAYKLTVETP